MCIGNRKEQVSVLCILLSSVCSCVFWVLLCLVTVRVMNALERNPVRSLQVVVLYRGLVYELYRREGGCQREGAQ